MHLRRFAAALAFGLALAAAAPWPARAEPRVPAGFAVEDVVPGVQFEAPTSITALPDGRLLIGEQPGRVWLVTGGALSAQPVWAAEDEILYSLEAGLIGLAVDPDFANNRYLYFYYTVDPDSNGVDDESGAFGRLTRYRLRDDGSDTVDPASRTILMGASWADGPLTGINTHTVGSLRWGTDGSLLLGAGDGDHWNDVDAGGLYPHVFAPGRSNPAEDIGAFRAQSLSSLCGKILRIDPATGLGLPSNPFWNGDAASPRSKIYAYGLRNPYRFCVRPGTGDPDPSHGDPGVLFVGDVGWYRWEELEVITQPGLNYGWPCLEGFLPQVEYSASTPFRLGCDSVGVSPDDPVPPTQPTAVWSHGVASASVPSTAVGGATVGGIFYTGSLYPAQYRGRYFHADYGQGGGWIRSGVVTPDHRVISFDNFGTTMDAPVELYSEPLTGNVLYVSYFTGQIRRIVWTGAPGGNAPPVAFGRVSPTLGVAPLAVECLASGSFDPDGGAVSTHWEFDDADNSGTDLADPIHVFEEPGIWRVELLVTDALGATDIDTFTVVVVDSTVIPTVPVLDGFNRPDGALGDSWLGNQSGMSIANGELVHSAGEGRAFWSGGPYPNEQEVWVTLGTDVDRATRVALLLKAQGIESDDARLEVSYHPALRQVIVATDDNAFGNTSRGAPIPVEFLPGDRFAARTLQGRVEVFRNDSRIAWRSLTGWPQANSSGLIGLWLETPAPAAGARRPATPTAPPAFTHLLAPRAAALRLDPGAATGLLDDFGGGEIFVPGNRKPLAAIGSPPDSSFFDATQSITLVASPSDEDDPPDSLVCSWMVYRHHSNRVDVGVPYSGPVATFTPIDPEDEAGTWYRARLIVLDTEGLSDTTEINLFPETDLVPSGVVTNAGHLPPGTPAELGFWIRNDGPLISARSFWRVLLDTQSIGMAMINVPGHDSVHLQIALPPLAAGPHRLRVIADTLRQCVETDESNNVVLVNFDVQLENVGAGADLPRAFALSAALPNPARGEVRFRLELPEAGEVAMEIHDVQGRIVHAEPARQWPAGRGELRWNGRVGGAVVPAGVYLARVRAGGRQWTRRVAVVH